jgi:hypothetical protein
MSRLGRCLRLGLAGVLPILSACDRERAAEPGVVRADSAGIQLVTSTGPDTALAWRFEEVGVMLDSLGQPYLFTQLWSRGVVTDRAGRIYVLTRDPSVLRFGRDGRLDLALGRRGEGPGEMQLPAILAVQGDTLAVLDLMKRALVRWSPIFDPASDRRLEGALAGANDLAFRTGGVWFQQWAFTDSSLRVAFHSDTSGTPLHVVEQPSGGAVRFSCVGLNQSSPLFNPTITWSASGARVLVNAGTGYDLHLYEGARPVAVVRREVPSRAPTVEDVRELYPEGYQVRFGGDQPACVVPVEEVMRGFGVAPVYPAVHDLTLLNDGTMWVQRNPRAAATPVIDVFASNGAYAGSLRGMRLPLGRLPNGELLVPRPDEDTGGWLLARLRVVQ